MGIVINGNCLAKMKDKNKEELIIKFIAKSITERELDDLSRWMEKAENEQFFKEYVHINYALDYNLINFDAEKTKLMLFDRIKKAEVKEGKVRYLALYRYAAVAAVVILVVSTVLFFTGKSDVVAPPMVQTEIPILPGTDKAILTLEDGTQVTLEKGKQFQTDKLKSEGEQIVYNDTPKEDAELVYNYLTIPRGGQFFVQLSDSTKVWLNSESKLKYPVEFPENQDRVVELVYGEAYFDVSPSSNHGGVAFKVMTQSQYLEVLGTEFNVRAYRDKNHIYTTLVEGAVEVGNGVGTETLGPGQQSVLARSDESLMVQQVDVMVEVAWRHGYFMFDQMSLGDMMEQLSRWYDFEPNFENNDIKAMTFSGRLNRSEDLNELLDYIQGTGIVSFENQNGVLMIK